MTAQLRLLFTGSRRHKVGQTDHILVAGLIEVGAYLVKKYNTTARDITLIHGAQGVLGPGGVPVRGADVIAGYWWRRWGLPVEEFPADWDGPCATPMCTAGHRRAYRDGRGDYCPTAGPWRNQQMVAAGFDECLACPLPGSRGTTGCMREVKQAGGVPRVRWDPAVPIPVVLAAWRVARELASAAR